MHSVVLPKILPTDRSVEIDLRQYVLHSANFLLITPSQIIFLTLGVLSSFSDDMTLAFSG